MQAQKYHATADQDHRVLFVAPDLPDGTQLEIIALVMHRPVEKRTNSPASMALPSRADLTDTRP